MPALGIVGVEDDLSAGSTRRGGQTLREHLSLGEGQLVEDRVEELVEFVGFAAQEGGLLVDQALMEHVAGDLHHGCSRTLAVAALEEPELALLYGELHVLHVAVVVLECVLDGIELLVDLGHRLFHRGIFGYALFLGDAVALGPAL